MKKESADKVKITPPNWQEVAARSVRETFPKELRRKALEILEDPEKAEKLLRLILAKQQSGDTVDFIGILYWMACYAVEKTVDLPTMINDRDELKRQAQAAKQLHRRMANLAGYIRLDPNTSYYIHRQTWPEGTSPKTPPMTDATILWALETVADYLKIRGEEGPRMKAKNLNLHVSIIRLEKELRKAKMKGDDLYDALALALSITRGRPYTAGSAKVLLMRARSILPWWAETGNE